MTRVGLLVCDHVDERYRSVGPDYPEMFAALFAQHAPEVELVPVDVVAGERPGAPDALDGWVGTGSRHSVYEDIPWIHHTSAFLREVHAAGVPFVGVCFGHQLLAHALGGRVTKAPGGWGAGVHRVDLEPAAPWMHPRAEHLALHFMHQDQVVELPPGATVLGRAGHCPIAVQQVGSMVGIQAHPEFTAAYADALLADRVARIGAAEVEAARASLAQPTDEGIVATWMARALTPSLRPTP